MRSKPFIYINLIIWGIVITALILLLVYITKTNGFGSSDYSILKEESFAVSEISIISVNMSSHNVNLYLSEDTNVKIIDRSTNSGNKPCNMEQKGSTIYVESKFEFSFFNFAKRSLDIFLPTEYKDILNIDTTSGNIKVYTDLNLSEGTLKTTSGNIEIENNKIESDTLSIKSTSGNIKLSEAICNAAELKTTSGNINAANISGTDTIASTSGQIKIDQCTGNQNYKISCTSGNIKLGGLNAGGSISTTSGNINAIFSSYDAETSFSAVSGNINITYPSGSGIDLYASHTSGKVKADFTTNPGDRHTTGQTGEGALYKLSAKTTSGNIILTAQN